MPERLADTLLDRTENVATEADYFTLTHLDDALMTEQEIRELPKVWVVGGDAELVHVVAAEHRGRVGILAAGVRVNLRVEHQDLHVRPVLQHDLRNVLESDVTERAVAADDPHLRQLADFLLRHQ